MAPAVVLWLGLGSLLLLHALVRGTLVTGQSALTGAWWLSATALLGDPKAAVYVTPRAVALILSVHLVFGIASVTVGGSRGRAPDAGSRFSARGAVWLFWPAALAGLLGGVLCARYTGALEAARAGQLAFVRASLLEGTITIPARYRLLGNAMYPAVVLGSIAALATSRRGLWYFGLPLGALALYSLAQGGRGPLLVGALAVLWSLAIGLGHRGLERTVRRKIRRTALLLLSLLIAYSAYVVTTRGDEDRPISSLSRYFTDPMPAFSEWLQVNNRVELLSAKLSNLAVVREGLNIAGASATRSVDQLVVFVPEPFNVFTGLAEELDTLGLIGTLLLFLVLGGAAAWVERAGWSAVATAWRVVLYTYLTYTLFVDLACYITGFWLMAGAAALVAFVQPAPRGVPGDPG